MGNPFNRPRAHDKDSDISVINKNAFVANSKIKNDLFQKDTNLDYEEDSVKSFKILAKFGFSKKTVQLTKNLNQKIRKDLSLSDLEYLVLLPYFASKKFEGIIHSESVSNLVNGDFRVCENVYETQIDLYKRNILSPMSYTAGIPAFKMTLPMIEYLKTGKFDNPKKDLTLREVIRLVDVFANAYNDQPKLVAITEVLIIDILEKNSHFSYCKALLDFYKSCFIGEPCVSEIKDVTDYFASQMTLYILGHLILRGDTQLSKNSEFIDMFISSQPERESAINAIFMKDASSIFERKIFDRAIDESGKADKNTIEIHSDFRREHLQDIFVEKQNSDKISSVGIVEKQLFFNEKNQKSIDDLTTLLSREKFNEIKNRLTNVNTRSGFTCIFSGSPGTGKTECCLQIAKKTGRDIVKVDISGLRSKWWGEDEKNIKSIFKNYKFALQESRIEPILLLNEADAILGRRLDVGGNNGAIISSINAVQNILLEELENFNGILIATTNLTQNMDDAFDRRFLYKIEFDKPNLDSRSKIWETMLEIDFDIAKRLAAEFEFTGAQIENILRRREAKRILYGEEFGYEALVNLCKEETIKKEIKIGF